MLSKETDITKYQEGVSDHDLFQSYVEPVDVKYKKNTYICLQDYQ